MKVLFYVGYQKEAWDGNTTSGLAGSEVAVQQIAKHMVLFGYNVVVSGDVLHSGKIDGVEYCSLQNIHDLHFNTFDIIVGTSYSHFVLEFEKYTRAKKVFWAHNTDSHTWWNGSQLDSELINNIHSENHNYLDATVTLTSWHSAIWYGLHDWASKRQHVIGNGIDKSTFIGHPPKVLNSFIWSSAIDRGLVDLLKNWPRIKDVLPDATLNVYWPEYSSGYSQMDYIEEHRETLEGIGVTFHGPASQEALHSAMLKSDFWCYLSGYEETYCITALEMQYAKVLPIVAKVAALKETVTSGIILEHSETMWDNLIQTLKQLSPSLKRFAKEKAHQWASKQTWSERAYDWKTLFDMLIEKETEQKELLQHEN